MPLLGSGSSWLWKHPYILVESGCFILRAGRWFNWRETNWSTCGRLSHSVSQCICSGFRDQWRVSEPGICPDVFVSLEYAGLTSVGELPKVNFGKLLQQMDSETIRRVSEPPHDLSHLSIQTPDCHLIVHMKAIITFRSDYTHWRKLVLPKAPRCLCEASSELETTDLGPGGCRTTCNPIRSLMCPQSQTEPDSEKPTGLVLLEGLGEPIAKEEVKGRRGKEVGSPCEDWGNTDSPPSYSQCIRQPRGMTSTGSH